MSSQDTLLTVLDMLLEPAHIPDWLTVAVSLVGAALSATDLIRRFHSYGLGALEKFRIETARRANLCTSKTGYVGALLARYTAIITLNLLLFNVLMNLTTMARTSVSALANVPYILEILYGSAVACALSVIFIVFIIMAICNEVLRSSESVE